MQQQLSTDVEQALQRWQKHHSPGPYVYPSPQRRRAHLFRSMINRLMDQYLAAAGLTTRYSLHCLRHTFATQLLNAGVPLEILKELFGPSPNFVPICTQSIMMAGTYVSFWHWWAKTQRPYRGAMFTYCVEQQRQVQRAATPINRRLNAPQHFFDYLATERQTLGINPVKPSHFLRRGHPLPKALSQDQKRFRGYARNTS